MRKELNVHMPKEAKNAIPNRAWRVGSWGFGDVPQARKNLFDIFKPIGGNLNGYYRHGASISAHDKL